MAIPLAVSPGVLTPGLYMNVDLLAGAASPNTGTLRIALMGSKSASGDLTVDTEVRVGGGADTAGVAFGLGTPAHLAAVQIYEQYPTAIVDFIAPTAGAGTAQLNLTLSGTTTSNNSIDIDVMGRTFQIAWLTAETADAVADKIVAAINERTADLFVTAIDGGVGIVTIDAKTAGNEGNDVKVTAVLTNAATGTEAIAGAATPTPLVGGATDPVYTTALSNISGQEYHLILPCLSNTDITNIATKNNFGLLVDHINTLNTGLNASLQQGVAGCSVASIGSITAAAPAANGAQNDPVGEIIYCINGRGLPAELGGREVGGRIAAESIDPAANRIGEVVNQYIGAVDRIADKPTIAESETILGAGVSLISYTAQGLEVLVRAITTHSQDSAGAPDRRLLDVQNVSATYIVARDVRAALPAEFPQTKISKDVPPGDDPPPKGVIEERDIKAFLISRLQFWVTQGVITQDSLTTAVTGGTLIVEVNDSDATQVDIVLPFSIVQPLAKFGVVVQRVPN